MTKRICITVPDNVEKKLNDFMETYPNNKRKNVSEYISNLINKHTPLIEID